MTAEERAANRLIASFHEAGHVVVGDALGGDERWKAHLLHRVPGVPGKPADRATGP